jgi:hypothetical protein
LPGMLYMKVSVNNVTTDFVLLWTENHW